MFMDDDLRVLSRHVVGVKSSWGKQKQIVEEDKD